MAENTNLKDSDKVIDTLTTMYLEQQNMARHHETQRSSVATIFSSLATAILAVIGAIWKTNEPFDQRFLPLTLALLFLGILGHLLNMKLFERSVSHFSISEGYLNTIDTLISQDVLNMAQGKIKEIRYVKDSIGKMGWDFRTDKNGERKVKTIKFTEENGNDTEIERVNVNNHNPVNPREIVTPLHNETAKYHILPFVSEYQYAKLDLFQLWEAIYALIIITGFVLTIISIC